MIVVTDEVFGERGQVARGNAVAAVPALLDVGSVNGQNVALPLPRREAHPGMRREFGRMRPAIHPNGPVLLVGADVVADSDDVLGLRIAFFPDPELKRATIDVCSRVYLALMLFESQPVGIPAQGPLPRCVVDGNPKVVNQFGAGNPLRLILLEL